AEGVSFLRVPRVLRIAPGAADRAALQPDENRWQPKRDAFALDRAEHLRDADDHRHGTRPPRSGSSKRSCSHCWEYTVRKPTLNTWPACASTMSGAARMLPLTIVTNARRSTTG